MPPGVRLCLSYSLPALGLCGIGGPDDYLDFSKQHHDVRYGSLADPFDNNSGMSAFPESGRSNCWKLREMRVRFRPQADIEKIRLTRFLLFIC